MSRHLLYVGGEDHHLRIPFMLSMRDSGFRVTATSNEPSDPSDPDVVVIPDGSGGFVVELRAERLGSGSGRLYTLTATATDLADNVRTVTATCAVAHDQR